MNVFERMPGTKAWRRRRDVKLCLEATERIQEIVDGELPASRATVVLERHLAACKRCSGEATVIRELKVAIARCSGEADPETLGRLEELARKLCEGTANGAT